MILECEHCGFSRQVPDKYAGKTVKCPKCKASITLVAAPAPGAPPADPAATVAKGRSPAPPEKGIPRYSIAEFVQKTRQKGGESIQMSFDGDGFVVVQPYEEAYFQAG